MASIVINTDNIGFFTLDRQDLVKIHKTLSQLGCTVRIVEHNGICEFLINNQPMDVGYILSLSNLGTLKIAENSVQPVEYLAVKDPLFGIYHVIGRLSTRVPKEHFIEQYINFFAKGLLRHIKSKSPDSDLCLKRLKAYLLEAEQIISRLLLDYRTFLEKSKLSHFFSENDNENLLLKSHEQSLRAFYFVNVYQTVLTYLDPSLNSYLVVSGELSHIRRFVKTLDVDNIVESSLYKEDMFFMLITLNIKINYANDFVDMMYIPELQAIRLREFNEPYIISNAIPVMIAHDF